MAIINLGVKKGNNLGIIGAILWTGLEKEVYR